MPCHPDCGLCKAGTNPCAEMYPELEVPPTCGRWPKCEGEHKGDSYFDIDAWRWSDSTCSWPACVEPVNMIE